MNIKQVQERINYLLNDAEYNGDMTSCQVEQEIYAIKELAKSGELEE